jgi:hypothetical protein
MERVGMRERLDHRHLAGGQPAKLATEARYRPLLGSVSPGMVNQAVCGDPIQPRYPLAVGPGDQVKLTVQRGSSRITVTVKVVAQPAQVPSQ